MSLSLSNSSPPEYLHANKKLEAIPIINRSVIMTNICKLNALLIVTKILSRKFKSSTIFCNSNKDDFVVLSVVIFLFFYIRKEFFI